MFTARAVRRKAMILALLLVLPLAAVAVHYAIRPVESVLSATRMIRDIAYGDLPAQRLDIYVPQQARKASVIVFFYGGTWIAGSKNSMTQIGEALAKAGYVAVIPDYRLYPAGHFPDFMIDSARAIAWVHNNIQKYDGDPFALFISGHSAGAYNAVMLGLDPHYLTDIGGSTSWIRGIIALAGPYDFQPTDADVADVFAGAEKAAMYPLDYVDGKKPPMLLITGDRDTIVPAQDSQNMAKRLQQAGNPVSLKVYSGVGHTDLLLGLATGNMPVLKDIKAFTTAILGGR